MSANAARQDFASLRTTISRALRGTLFIAVPATVGLIIVARPLISAAFEHGKFASGDTNMVVQVLGFYALGLCGYFAQQILARAFYSMQDSRMPMRSALVAVFANFILNLTLIWYLGCAGLACATAICSYLQVVILVAVLRRRLGPSILEGLFVALVKTLAATAVMGLVGMAILVLMRNLPDGRLFDILTLIVAVPSAAAGYLLSAKVLRIEELALLTGGKPLGE